MLVTRVSLSVRCDTFSSPRRTGYELLCQSARLRADAKHCSSIIYVKLLRLCRWEITFNVRSPGCSKMRASVNQIDILFAVRAFPTHGLTVARARATFSCHFGSRGPRATLSPRRTTFTPEAVANRPHPPPRGPHKWRPVAGRHRSGEPANQAARKP